MGAVRKEESATSKRKRPQGAKEAISDAPTPLQSPLQFQPTSEAAAPSTPSHTSTDFIRHNESVDANVGFSDHSDNDNEGESENSQFEAAFAVSHQMSSGHAQSSAHHSLPNPREDEVIRQMWEKSIEQLVLEFNGAGSFGDHLE